jgi:ATP-dependent Clp protease adaptor protein ClpS
MPLDLAPSAADTRGVPATLTAPAVPEIELDEETLRRLVPPYHVILHNDDHNSMAHVVRALRLSVPSLSDEDAVRIMFEAHTNGQATVITCAREEAELYRDRLESFGLTATIEPA